MSGTGDARIIVTNCLLTLPCQDIFRQVNGLFHVAIQVILDDLLVLRCRWYDLCIKYQSLVIDPVAVIEYTARHLCAGIAGRGTWMNLHCWLLRLLVLLDDAQSFIERVHYFYTAHDDAFERIPALLSQTRIAGRFL